MQMLIIIKEKGTNFFCFGKIIFSNVGITAQWGFFLYCLVVKTEFIIGCENVNKLENEFGKYFYFK